MFGSTLNNKDVLTHDEYVDSFQKDLREAVRIAQANTTEAQKMQARQYNKSVKGTALDIGDRVLLANSKGRGKGKLADFNSLCDHLERPVCAHLELKILLPRRVR